MWQKPSHLHCLRTYAGNVKCPRRISEDFLQKRIKRLTYGSAGCQGLKLIFKISRTYYKCDRQLVLRCAAMCTLHHLKLCHGRRDGEQRIGGQKAKMIYV